MKSVEYLVSPSLDDSAQIDVYAADASVKPISDFLFAKFTEHLVNNIYHGMWAQILENPSFEAGCFFAADNKALKAMLTPREPLRESWRETWIALEAREAPPNVRLLDSFLEGVAYSWAKYGEGDVTYALVPDCVGSWTSQRIEIRSLKTPKVGIQQPIFLPLHREEEYELRLWLKGEAKRLVVTVETVSEKYLGGTVVTDINPEWEKHAVKFRVSKDKVKRGSLLKFSLSLEEAGTVYIDHCLLFPSDNIRGFDSDIVRLIKESDLTMLRYPGGSFTSTYNWKDGVGTVERRPIRRNIWGGAEYNHVGIDEFMDFCHLLGCEPLICVNAGSGGAKSAAQWVEYCNGNLDTQYGKLRAENGHPEPYNIRFWEIGNELYLGSCGAEEYAERYESFYDAMSKVDSHLKFIANGRDLEWNKTLAERNRTKLRSVSIHPHPHPPSFLPFGGRMPRETTSEQAYHILIGYAYWLREYLASIRDEMAKSIEEPRIAITELQAFTRGSDKPNPHTLSEALYYSGVVNTAISLMDFVEMITHSALVNHGGGLRKEREIVYANPVYYARKLYATQPGRFPVKLRVETPTFKVLGIANQPAVENVPYIDAVALLNDGRKSMSLIVSNRDPKKSIKTTINLHNFKAEDTVKMRTLNGSSYMAANSRTESELVKIVEGEVCFAGETLTYTFPAHSITLLNLRRERKGT